MDDDCWEGQEPGTRSRQIYQGYAEDLEEDEPEEDDEES